MALLEKEKAAAEENLRRQLAIETQNVLNQQEKELAALIGRLEVRYQCPCFVSVDVFVTLTIRSHWQH